MNIFRWKHIHDLDHPESVYLSRLMLVKLPWVGVYLHIIRRADYARCQHDHPWPFVTFILRGGYEEQVGEKLFVRRPGYVGFRPRSFEHRITRLLSDVAVTLVVRGPDHIAWGFRTNNGERLLWEQYIKLPAKLRVLWCDDK